MLGTYAAIVRAALTCISVYVILVLDGHVVVVVLLVPLIFRGITADDILEETMLRAFLSHEHGGVAIEIIKDEVRIDLLQALGADRFGFSVEFLSFQIGFHG